MNPLLHRAAALVMLLPTLACADATAAAAGEVALVTGQAQASSQATLELRALSKGDAVFAGDIVTAGPNTYVNLKFTDGSFVLVRPNSRFEIEAYRNPEAGTAAPAATPAPATAPAAGTPTVPAAATPGRGQAFFRLLKGGFRAVTGLIGRSDPAEYRVSTPVATIGIRGTDYLTVICDAICAADPVVLASLMPGCSTEARPESDRSCVDPTGKRPSALGGIIVGVISGLVFTVNINGEEIEIGPGQYLLTLPDGTQILLARIPEFLELNPIPDPTELCES